MGPMAYKLLDLFIPDDWILILAGWDCPNAYRVG